jgi:hypothetical protein
LNNLSDNNNKIPTSVLDPIDTFSPEFNGPNIAKAQLSYGGKTGRKHRRGKKQDEIKVKPHAEIENEYIKMFRDSTIRNLTN